VSRLENSRRQKAGVVYNFFLRWSSGSVKVMFNSQLFRWNVALARIAQRIGDSETVERAARTALSQMSRPPQFPRHPDVGIPNADDSTLAWLREAATTGGRGTPGPRIADA
jgi:hypothetical protein